MCQTVGQEKRFVPAPSHTLWLRDGKRCPFSSPVSGPQRGTRTPSAFSEALLAQRCDGLTPLRLQSHPRPKCRSVRRPCSAVLGLPRADGRRGAYRRGPRGPRRLLQTLLSVSCTERPVRRSSWVEAPSSCFLHTHSGTADSCAAAEAGRCRKRRDGGGDSGRTAGPLTAGGPRSTG